MHFFVLCESSILNVNVHNMNKQAEEGNKQAKRILQLMNNPKTITTYQVLTTMFAFFACAFAYQKFAPSLIGWMETFMPIHHTVLSGFALVIIAFILLIFFLIFGVMIPRRIGIFRSDGVAMRICGIYNGVCILLFLLHGFCIPLWHKSAVSLAWHLTQKERNHRRRYPHHGRQR